MGRERRTLRGVELQADRVADLAHRRVAELRRRDVAIALLSVPAADALASLPTIRRGLLAAGNPLSAPFWDSAETILQKISEHDATFGDVHGWLEATGTEPTGIIGLHVWAEPATRSPLQEEMHARLVGHLEELLAAGEIDPDRLATGDEDARREYVTLQERWMTSPLPDGRVPMTVLLDEQDEAFLADWAAADAEARAALHSMLAAAGERPLPAADLRAAVAKLRGDIAQPGWPGQMLVSFSGRNADSLPSDDAELWLTLATSVAAPQGGPLSDEDKEFARAMEWAEEEDLEFGDDLDDDERTTTSPTSCRRRSRRSAPSITSTGWRSCRRWSPAARERPPRRPTWPGTSGTSIPSRSSASPWSTTTSRSPRPSPRSMRRTPTPTTMPTSRSRSGVEVDDDDDFDKAALLFEDADFGAGDFDEDDDEDFDELSIEELFLNVTAMWSVLGAIDSDDRLTPLGWWGLPEAMSRAWTEPEAE